MTEMWINNDEDYKEFVSYLKESPNFLSSAIDNNNVIFDFPDMRVFVPKEYISKYGLTEVSKPTYDPLIFGKGTTERIVNVTVDNEQVYIYKSDGTVDIQDYSNWAIGSRWDEGCSRLKGNQYYKYIKDLPEDQFYSLKENWNPSIWTPRTASEGFLLRSGETYYKGMKVSDVSLLSFDIEATTLDKDDPEALVPLFSTTYRDKQGKITKQLFDIFEYDNKDQMWLDIHNYVKTTNPDIILGHNILSYDLPYANKNSLAGLYWGRDGSKIVFDQKASKMRKDGSQSYEYFNVNINGREIIDTFFLSIKYDTAREFPSYGLKAIEKHLGLVKEDRTWDFSKWSVKKLIEDRRVGNTEMWNKFREYCQDDSDSPIKMFDLMIPSFFYLTQSVPKTLQQVVNEASGSALDCLMIRSYLQDGYSLPRSSQKVEFEGAISMGIPGIYTNVRKVDVASLYPSIMLEYDIYDKQKDPNRNMLKILEYFRNERLNNKKLAKETGNKYYDDIQNAQKIVINSMYGFLGAGFLLFNYPEGAAEVTKHGREILLKGVEWNTGHTLEKVVKSVSNEGTDEAEEKFHWILGKKVSEGLGYQLVNVDTDSFSYTNGILPTKSNFKEEITKLNTLYSSMIEWEDDGVYENFIVVKAKNYILKKHKDWCKDKELDEFGNSIVKYKGSSLTDQKKEPRLLKFLKELINVLLTSNNEEELLEIFNTCTKDAYSTFNVKDWVMKKTVTDSVINAKRANEQKPLDAINQAVKAGVISGYQEGDKIYLYQAIDGLIQAKAKGELVFSKKGEPKMIENTILKFSELYNKDQDVMHYVERVYKTLEILKNVLDIEKFPKYHLKKNQELLKQL